MQRQLFVALTGKRTRPKLGKTPAKDNRGCGKRAKLFWEQDAWLPQKNDHKKLLRCAWCNNPGDEMRAEAHQGKFSKCAIIFWGSNMSTRRQDKRKGSQQSAIEMVRLAQDRMTKERRRGIKKVNHRRIQQQKHVQKLKTHGWKESVPHIQWQARDMVWVHPHI